MSKQINLQPGQVAVILTPGPEDTFGSEALWYFPDLDSNDADAVADAFFFQCLARGMASLAIDSTDLVYEAGEETLAREVKADAV
jgi:hypothetical protein